MENSVATLTHEQQALVWPIRTRGVAAPGAGEAGVVGIHLHRHTARQRGFIGNIAVQFSKGPLRRMPVALALFAGDTLGALPVWLTLVGTPFGAFADLCQVFQADDAAGVRVPDAMADPMIAMLFQPPLSSTQHSE